MKKVTLKALVLLLFVIVFTYSATLAFSYFDNLSNNTNESIPVGDWITTISTPQEFFDMATDSSSEEGDVFFLTQDIDFSSFDWTINTSNDNTIFRGKLDGNGYKITNLTIYTENTSNTFLGIFGTVQNAEITNLILENVHIEFFDTALSRTNYRSGLIAGRLRGDTTISNISIIDSSVKATRNSGAGGLIGIISGSGVSATIENIKARNLKVFNKSNYAGGLVGNVENEISSLYISNIDFEGEVFAGGANGYVGGLLGRLKNGPTVTINNVIVEYTSINTIETNATYYNKYTTSNIGGIIGYNLNSGDFTISNTFFTGSLITEVARKSIYVGTLYGRVGSTDTGTNNYYAAVQFKHTDGLIYYDPDPNFKGIFSTEVNNGTLPNNNWWNIFSNNFDMNIWSQDGSGRLYLT